MIFVFDWMWLKKYSRNCYIVYWTEVNYKYHHIASIKINLVPIYLHSLKYQIFKISIFLTLNAVINNISSDDLTSEDQLIAEMRPATVGLPLPAVDLDPHFRYLDEMEELEHLVSGRITKSEAKRS